MSEAQATPRVTPTPEQQPSSSASSASKQAPQLQQPQQQRQQSQQQNNALSQQSSLKTPKDKNCPFCGQAFTSSSLGRHLDLYIRPKNPKPSDGLHLVDEIRKIRGGITRRQVKGPLKKERSSGARAGQGSDRHASARTPANKRQSVVSISTSRAGDRSESPQDDDDGHDEQDQDLDPDDDDEMEDDSLLDLSVSRRRGGFKDVGAGAGAKMLQVGRRFSQKVSLERRHTTSDELETARATELALRELLRSVKEANTKATSSALFDFDPYTLNFPSLCLRVLPPPSTLFSPTPFPTSESWSINPPGQKQFDTLNKQVRERLLAHQRQRQINQAYPTGAQSNSPSGNTSPLPTPPLFDPDPEKLFCHIADAYSHWMHQPEHARQEFWQVEILRSYARANDLRREAEMNLQQARRELEFFRSHRPGPELSPVSYTLGSETVRELGKFGMDFRNWDYDRLIEKWKAVVRESKNSTAGMMAQKPLPGLPSTRSCSMTSLPGQSFAPGNSQSQNSVKMEQAVCSAPATVNGQEPSSDQADAEGDDDDTPVDLEAIPVSNSLAMSDHHHVAPHQPTPVHPSQMHAHLQSQVHVQQQQHQQHMQAAHQAQLSQAQAQAWAVARQHMNHSRNSHHPHQHQQLSPHPQHMGSAANSRRQSGVLLDPHAMGAGNMLPMDGIEIGMVSAGSAGETAGRWWGGLRDDAPDEPPAPQISLLTSLP